jgi:hypothetical protein
VRSCYGEAKARPDNNMVQNLRESFWELRYKHMNSLVIKHKNGLGFVLKVAMDVSLPLDIRSDARMIFKDWSRKIFNPDLLRGTINNGKGVDPESKIEANREGHNGLEIGQWWPRFSAAHRDGAISSLYGGITTGAFAVVMSMSSQYLDEDNGDVIKYSGTNSATQNGPDTITRGTGWLIDAQIKGKLVRVIRARGSNIKKGSEYLPSKGMRYDGLYKIKEFQLHNVDGKESYVFTMVRVEGQEPIRYQAPGARPNKRDLEAFERLPAWSRNEL